MNKLKRFIKFYKSGIIAVIGVFLIFATIFFLYGFPFEAIFYPFLLSIVFMFVLFLIDDTKKRNKIKQLNEIEKLPFLEKKGQFPKSADDLEEKYQELISDILTESNLIISDYESRLRDQRDYYACWAHQIKTPIASMKLKLESIDSKDARVLLQNLRRTESYVDMVMTYIRLASEHTDYIIKEESIKKLVNENLRKFSLDFIERKLSINVSVEDEMVLTDAKWAAIILEQILSNAIKYTKEGGVSIVYESGKGILHIKDTGMGIDKANLPRIFEKGYTGFNGRSEAHSSGIGLYIAKLVADNLKIQIEVESEVNKGTEFIIHFPLDKTFYE